MNIEFEFIDKTGQVVDAEYADYMCAHFHCLKCNFILKMSKEYEPVPLHYQSRIKKRQVA